MSDSPIRLAISGLAISGLCFWLYFAFYNIVICSLLRSWFKTFLKGLNAALSLLAIPLFLVTHFDIAWVQQVLTLRPTSAPAWAVLGVVGAMWTVGLSFQTWLVIRRLFPPPIPNLVSLRRRLAHFRPSRGDWDIYRELRDAPPISLPKDTPAPPPLRHKMTRIHPHPIRTRILHAIPFSYINQSHRLEIVEMTLLFPHLPPAFDGLRIVHLSDMHFGEYLSPRYHRYVVDRALALNPDVAVITGDYTASDNLYRESIEVFSRLRPPLGAWSVHGNHDYYTEPEVLAYWLEHYGVKYLCNRFVDIEREGQQVLRLIGVDHPFRRVCDWDALTRDDRDAGRQVFRLALTHRPDNAIPLIRHGADLVLSGHTHGGQWRIPGVGPLIIPSIYGRRFDRGLIRIGPGLLYINSGFGVHTIPLRLNCPPEIALIELRRS